MAAGLAGTIALVMIDAGAVLVTVAAIYWFLISRGFLRWCALALAVLAPLVLVVLHIQAGLLLEMVLSVGLAFVALVCARAALRERGEGKAMPEYPAPAWRHAFLVMNPRSGGGKVVKFDLQRKAEELGAEVALLEGPGQVDVDALARQAVERGADLLGVAGGDGTQALVAGIAAEHNLPFLVISAGTRNHFALDLGLDREDPTGCLDALRDGVELHVDLGKINGRTFVNNASFGVYAEVVQSPEYRDDKAGTVLEMLPDLIRGDKGARLRAQVDGADRGRPAGGAGEQRSVRQQRPRRPGPPNPAGPRRARRGGALRRQHPRSGRPAAPCHEARPDPTRGGGGGGRRRRARDPRRSGRRGSADEHAGAVHHRTPRTAGTGSAEPSRRPAGPTGAGPGPAP